MADHNDMDPTAEGGGSRAGGALCRHCGGTLLSVVGFGGHVLRVCAEPDCRVNHPIRPTIIVVVVRR